MPDGFFGQSLTLSLLRVDESKNITAISKLHHDAETVSCILKKGFFVANDIRVADWGENSDLVESILFLFAAEFDHFDLLHGIGLVVRCALDSVDLAEGTLA